MAFTEKVSICLKNSKTFCCTLYVDLNLHSIIPGHCIQIPQFINFSQFIIAFFILLEKQQYSQTSKPAMVNRN